MMKGWSVWLWRVVVVVAFLHRKQERGGGAGGRVPDGVLREKRPNKRRTS
jgi:hypothetical protein